MKEKLSLPKGWELKTIGDVCVSASSNVSQNKLADDEGDYPIFGASGLIKKVSFYHRDKPYLSIVKDGSGVGRVTKMDAYTSVIGTLQYILPRENIDLDYLNYSLMSVDFKNMLQVLPFRIFISRTIRMNLSCGCLSPNNNALFPS